MKDKNNVLKIADKKAKIKGWFKNELGYWAGLISAIVTIIGAFKLETLPMWAGITWLAIVAIVIIIFIVRLFIYIENTAISKSDFTERYKRDVAAKINQYKECSEEIHKCFHNIRNDMCEMSNCLIDSEINSNLYEHIMKNICSDIEAVFQKLWKKEKISVCIKRIITDNGDENDYRKWKVETVARGSNTKQNRNKNNNKPVSIMDNSDFLIIISPEYEDSVFSCMDLTKVKEVFANTYSVVYKNSTEGYINIYKSTIVVPIRIQVDKMNATLKEDWMEGIDYHIVGFLCIDSDYIFSSEETAVFDTGIELAKAFADILYKLIEIVLIGKSR